MELVCPNIVVQSGKWLRSNFSGLKSHVMTCYLSVMKNNSEGPHKRIVQDKMCVFDSEF